MAEEETSSEDGRKSERCLGQRMTVVVVGKRGCEGLGGLRVAAAVVAESRYC